MIGTQQHSTADPTVKQSEEIGMEIRFGQPPERRVHGGAASKLDLEQGASITGIQLDLV
jgi:hypothetical protein